MYVVRTLISGVLNSKNLTTQTLFWKCLHVLHLQDDPADGFWMILLLIFKVSLLLVMFHHGTINFYVHVIKSLPPVDIVKCCLLQPLLSPRWRYLLWRFQVKIPTVYLLAPIIVIFPWSCTIPTAVFSSILARPNYIVRPII